MVIFKTAGNVVAGAFSNATWRSSNSFKNDDFAFLFSFKDNIAQRFAIQQANVAVNDQAAQLPSYGQGDLTMPSNLVFFNASSTLSGAYQGSGSIAESTSFKIVALEIFTLNNVSDAVCFGVSANSAFVCSGRGTCVRNNTCVCYANSGGANCDENMCFGVLASNSSVCNGGGTCNGGGICSCRAGYQGTRCENIYCFALRSQLDRNVRQML